MNKGRKIVEAQKRYFMTVLQSEQRERISSNMRLKIRFEKPDDILEFVNAADQYPGEMDLCYGNNVVDAKSILGVMLLGIGKDLTLNIYSENRKDIELSMKRYQVASRKPS